MLHGLQNKKATLDQYYVMYEDDFEQRKEVEKTFRSILTELVGIITARPGGRWRKKSDFYSLFLVLANFTHEMPPTKRKRELLASALSEFSALVDKYLKDELKNPSRLAVKYGNAVERAASDIANRKARQEVLGAIVAKALKGN